MKIRKTAAAAIAFALLCGCAQPQQPENEELEKYTNLSVDAGFDTVFQMNEFGTDRKAMETYFHKCADMFREYNDLFDIYNDYENLSNLKTINDNAGIQPVKVDARIIDLLKEAKQFYEISNGAFDITIGSLLKVWHEYRDEGIVLNQNGENAPLPSMDELEKASAFCGWDMVEINEADSTVFIKEKGVSLDVGGIAKGFAAERIGEYMDETDIAYAAVNAGRNIRTVNAKTDGTPWVIGIASPADGSGVYCTVEMDGTGSFVTSGDYERYFIGEDGKRYHHIIDPKTLKPADYYHSVSIVTPDSSAADCLSTTLFTLSIEEGKKVLERYRKQSGDYAEAIWIMDPDASQNEKGTLSGAYYTVVTEGIEGRITFAQ